jgi:polysaccharide chain length determinant protein (PEP-CTERM system associated)
MNELAGKLALIGRGIWRNRWLAIAVMWALGLIGLGVSWFFPERFEAQAKVHVDTMTVLKPLMEGVTFQPDIDQQVKMLGKTLVSRPNVERIANDPTIGLLEAGQSSANEKLLDFLMKNIKVDQSGGNNLYAITFRDTDAQRARKVVDGFVRLFMTSGMDAKRRDSEEATRFIDEQIKEYEAKLADADTKVKEFKLHNMAVANANQQDYFNRITAIRDEISKTSIQLQSADHSREALRRELAKENPYLPGEAASSSSLTPDLDSRIETQKRQLDDLLRRYTEAHPDVFATRRTIKELEAERRRDLLVKLQTQTTALPVTTAPTSPVYQRLRIELAQAEAMVASLQAQIGAYRVRQQEFQAIAEKIPQAEAELMQLTRGYEVVRKQYEQLVNRREAASLGAKMDRSSSMAEFRLVEPPRVSPMPVFPSKKHLAALLMLASIILGMAAAFTMTLVHPTVSSEKELRELSKRPVLGVLTVLPDPRRESVLRQERLRVLGVVGAFLFIQFVWIGWMVFRSFYGIH